MWMMKRLLIIWGLGVVAGLVMWAVDRWAGPTLGTWILAGVVGATLLSIGSAMFRPDTPGEPPEAPSPGSWVYGEIGVLGLGGAALLTIAALQQTPRATSVVLYAHSPVVVPDLLRVNLPVVALEVLAIAAVALGILMLLLAVLPSLNRGFEGYAGPLRLLVRPLVAVLAWAVLFVGYGTAFGDAPDTGLVSVVLVWSGLVGVVVAGVHVLYAAVLSELRP